MQEGEGERAVRWASEKRNCKPVHKNHAISATIPKGKTTVLSCLFSKAPAAFEDVVAAGAAVGGLEGVVKAVKILLEVEAVLLDVVLVAFATTEASVEGATVAVVELVVEVEDEAAADKEEEEEAEVETTAIKFRGQ